MRIGWGSMQQHLCLNMGVAFFGCGCGHQFKARPCHVGAVGPGEGGRGCLLAIAPLFLAAKAKPRCTQPGSLCVVLAYGLLE